MCNILVRGVYDRDKSALSRATHVMKSLYATSLRFSGNTMDSVVRAASPYVSIPT